MKLWVKFKNNTPTKVPLGDCVDVDDFIKVVKREFSPRFDSVPSDCLKLSINEKVLKCNSLLDSEVLKSFANSAENPLVVTAVTATRNSQVSVENVSQNLDDLDQSVNVCKNESSVREIISRIVELLKDDNDSFIIEDQWESSSKIRNLSAKTQKYLLELTHPALTGSNSDDLTNIGKFCTGEFIALAPFFNGTHLDVIDSDSESLLELLPLSYRLLGIKFIQFELERLRAKRNIETEIDPKGISIIPRNETLLDYSYGRLSSSRFRFPDSIEILLAQMSTQEPFNVVKSLNLSGCQLFDDDMNTVVKIVARLPNCEYINLSSNRIYGLSGPLKEVADKNLIKLLTKSKVNLIGNAIVTIDRIDFFEKLSVQQLANLIWIHEIHLDGGGWKCMVKETELQKIVVQTHESFYA